MSIKWDEALMYRRRIRKARRRERVLAAVAGLGLLLWAVGTAVVAAGILPGLVAVPGMLLFLGAAWARVKFGP